MIVDTTVVNMRSAPWDAAIEACPVEGCGKPVRHRGFCVSCYYRQLRRDELPRIRKWRHRLSNIDEAAKTATCASCGSVKIVVRTPAANGLATKWRCAEDANHRSKLYKQAYQQARKEMLGPICEICGSADNLCWDHNHATGKFRGTLCTSCNFGVGEFGDDPGRLRAAANYLERTAQASINDPWGRRPAEHPKFKERPMVLQTFDPHEVTTVVNIKSGSPWDVLIDRRTIFGNPFRLGPERDRAGAIVKYREWFYKRVEEDVSFREAVLALRGKRLACWCAPKPCHGGIIVEWLETVGVDKHASDSLSQPNFNPGFPKP